MDFFLLHFQLILNIFTRHTIGWRAIWNDECNDLISDLKWKCKWKWKWKKNPIGLQWITLYRRIPQRHWLVSISEAIRRLPSMSGKNEEKNPSKNRKMKKKSINEWKSTFSLGLPSYCWGWGRSRSIFMITLHEAIKQDHQRTNEATDQTIILGLQIFRSYIIDGLGGTSPPRTKSSKQFLTSSLTTGKWCCCIVPYVLQSLYEIGLRVSSSSSPCSKLSSSPLSSSYSLWLWQ